jgi:hypothetical protein
MDEVMLAILRKSIDSSLQESQCQRVGVGELAWVCRHGKKDINLGDMVPLRHITTYENEAVYAGRCPTCGQVYYWQRTSHNYGDCPSGACSI